MTRRRPEQQLQKAVLQHLAWRGMPGVFAFHYGAGGWRTPAEAAIFKGLGVVAGIPDLIILYKGRCFALELKVEGGCLTLIQIETQARMRVAGVTVATTVGLDAALEKLECWGVLRPDVSVRRAAS